MKEHDRVKGFHRVAEMELRWPGRDVSLGGNRGPWGLGPGHCPVRLLILGSESLYAEGPERTGSGQGNVSTYLFILS